MQFVLDVEQGLVAILIDARGETDLRDAHTSCLLNVDVPNAVFSFRLFAHIANCDLAESSLYFMP